MQDHSKPIVLFALAVLVMGACEETSGSADDVDFSQLNGNDYILEVDRIMGTQGSDFDGFTEDNYEDTDQGNQYNVSFSENAETVTVEGAPFEEIVIVTGNKMYDGEDLKSYELGAPLFGGGHFSVWIAGDHFEAEYTIHGSGLPVILSERGRLVPADK
jgi:hypothetical protein